MKNSLMPALAVAALAVSTVLPAFAAPVTMASDATFRQDVLSSPTPVVVDFYADWCGPCRSMTPVVDRLASEYGNQVKFVRVNIDQSPGVASRLGISSIPAFRVFKNGRLVGSETGAVPEAELAGTINRAIGKAGY